MDAISTTTIYDGTVFCKKCGQPMNPVESMYSPEGICPHCRNLKYEHHAKKLMASRD